MRVRNDRIFAHWPGRIAIMTLSMNRPFQGLFIMGPAIPRAGARGYHEYGKPFESNPDPITTNFLGLEP